jgi:hypothetical protein
MLYSTVTVGWVVWDVRILLDVAGLGPIVVVYNSSGRHLLVTGRFSVDVVNNRLGWARISGVYLRC